MGLSSVKHCGTPKRRRGCVHNVRGANVSSQRSRSNRRSQNRRAHLWQYRTKRTRRAFQRRRPAGDGIGHNYDQQRGHTGRKPAASGVGPTVVLAADMQPVQRSNHPATPSTRAPHFFQRPRAARAEPDKPSGWFRRVGGRVEPAAVRADQLAVFAGEYVPLRLPGSRAAEAHWARDYPQSPRRANSASIAHQHRPPAVHTFRATLGRVDLAHGR